MLIVVHVAGDLNKTISFAVLQPLWWCCVDCMIHRERDVREE